jgi:hypothetical protein
MSAARIAVNLRSTASVGIGAASLAGEYSAPGSGNRNSMQLIRRTPLPQLAPSQLQRNHFPPLLMGRETASPVA